MLYLLKGRYEISGEKLGEGNSSKVFKAIDTYKNRVVAIKRMKNKKQAKKEAKIMERYPSHPHLIEFYDFFIEDRYAYIIMEAYSVKR